MKIRDRLVLGFTGIASLIAVVGYISFDAGQKALQKAIGESFVSLAAETLDKIDRSIYDRIEEFQRYSTDLEALKTTKESNEKFEKLDNIETFIRQKDIEWTSVPKGTCTAFMQKLMDNELSDELKAYVKFFEKKYGYKVLGEVFVTNKYGANVAQTRKTSDYYQADEEWWQVAKKDGLYIRDVKYDESAGVYSTDIGIKIDDENGNFVGVMKVVLNIEEAINIIEELRTTEVHERRKITYFKLLTRDGRLIYSTKPFEFSKDLSREKYISRALESGDGYFVVEADEPGEGERLFAWAGSKGYRDYKGLGWILAVEQQTKEVFASVVNLRDVILIIALLVTAFALLIGILTSRSIAVPIAKLKDATVELGKGNLDTKIEIKSKDEIGELAASFQRMTEDLKKTVDNLEKEVTERKRAEQALEKLNKELDSTVKNLIWSNKELRNFAYIIAHDLKSPVRAMGTLANWLWTDYGDKFDDQGKIQVKLLVNRAERMSELIDSILRYSEIGRVTHKKEEVDLNSLVTEVIAQIKPLELENIEITIENKLPTIMCEKPRLWQVFQELLSNAVKYMDKPNGWIKIGCVEEDRWWKFSVSDNGPGIEEKYFEKIFQIFQTLVRRDEFESTGIGLSLVKKIIEIYDGEVWVESKVGEGSTFFFTLSKQEIEVKSEELQANIVG